MVATLDIDPDNTAMTNRSAAVTTVVENGRKQGLLLELVRQVVEIPMRRDVDNLRRWPTESAILNAKEHALRLPRTVVGDARG